MKVIKIIGGVLLSLLVNLVIYFEAREIDSVGVVALTSFLYVALFNLIYFVIGMILNQKNISHANLFINSYILASNMLLFAFSLYLIHRFQNKPHTVYITIFYLLIPNLVMSFLGLKRFFLLIRNH